MRSGRSPVTWVTGWRVWGMRFILGVLGRRAGGARRDRGRHSNREAMTGEPTRRSQEAPPLDPAAALHAEIHALCDLLVLRPLPGRPVLRNRVLSALTACENAGETGLIPHLLRNLLRDLAGRAGPVDGAYYAVHLSWASSGMAR